MLSRKLKLPECSYLPWALYALAEAHLLAGNAEEGLRAAEEAANYRHHDKSAQGACLLLVAEAHHMCKRSADALRVANDALQLFIDCGDDKGEARAREALERFQQQPSSGLAAIVDSGVIGALAASAAIRDVEPRAAEPTLSLVETRLKVQELAKDVSGADDLED